MKTTNETAGVMLASQFAREIGLRPGNLWEPPISRGIAKDLEQYDRDDVEADWRFRLGLEQR